MAIPAFSAGRLEGAEAGVAWLVVDGLCLLRAGCLDLLLLAGGLCVLVLWLVWLHGPAAAASAVPVMPWPCCVWYGQQRSALACWCVVESIFEAPKKYGQQRSALAGWCVAADGKLR
ncbi:hypothetical protein CLOP_g22156 [Closterium sp. NIES-67]|nr:hypothetical protein CLOP_g22156 [Closterium sp. NIES-67]